jgi:tRNA dimethylallyltransferase
MLKPIFCLMGPTASGKTALACQLLEKFPFEIISVDSAMIYRGMNIGTAKPSLALLADFPHHLIDILDPPSSYSAAQFCADVQSLSQGIWARGKMPLLVGGSMMYFHALQQGLSTLPSADAKLRAQLLQQAEHVGWPAMHEMLEKADPKRAGKIHPHDTQRIQRALEIYYLSKEAPRPDDEPLKTRPLGHFINLVLLPNERAWLHERIALRFKAMLNEGFVEEVQGLLQKWPLDLSYPSMRSVGYRQAFLYLQGEYDVSTLCDKGIAATRQLAKRQLTWLRHWSSCEVFAAEDAREAERMVALIQQILDNNHHYHEENDV